MLLIFSLIHDRVSTLLMALRWNELLHRMDVSLGDLVVQLVLDKLLYHQFILRRRLKSNRLADRIPLEIGMNDLIQPIINAGILCRLQIRSGCLQITQLLKLSDILVLLCLKGIMPKPLILKLAPTLRFPAHPHLFCWTCGFLKRCIV